MLVKWIFLFILSYFIYRTIVTLFTAITGGKKRDRYFRNDPGYGRKESSGHDLRRQDQPTSDRKTASQDPDIEDAHWKDL